MNQVDKKLPCDYDLPMSGNDYLQFYAPHNVYHPGIDLNKGYGDSDCGNEIRSPRDGVVEFLNEVESKGHGFGLFVIIKYPDGTYSRMAHMKDIIGLVKGSKVSQGQLLGHVGKTGTSYCHCHFEVFTEELAVIQRAHVYPWCFYPSGKSRDWVQSHYINPWEWLKTSTSIPDWALSAVAKAKAKGTIIDWSNPYKIVGDETLEWTLEKSGLLDPAKHEGKITLVRWAVVLEKLNLI